MNPLANVHKHFRSRFKFVDGGQFFGQVLEPPDTSRVSNFLSARRYLRTGLNTPVKPRDVVVINGLKYIVAEHGDGFYIDPIYRHFKLFEVDLVETCYPVELIVNPVTRVEELIRATNIGDIYLSTQPAASVSDQMRIPTEQKIAVVNYELKVDDIVGKYVVVKVDKVLGVTLATLKEM